jgi:hypothetical protein
VECFVPAGEQSPGRAIYQPSFAVSRRGDVKRRSQLQRLRRK